jgi:CheY-like chemotaxis protein
MRARTAARDHELPLHIGEEPSGALVADLRHDRVPGAFAMIDQITTAPSPAPAVVLLVGAREPSPAAFLEGRHYDVVRLHSGAVALEWTSAMRPDAILVDSDLPDIAGFEVCRRLCDRGIDPTVPLMLLTPRIPAVAERLTALRAGAWDCLAFPDDAEDLALKLQAYLQVRRHMGWPAIERRRRQTAPRLPLSVTASAP